MMSPTKHSMIRPARCCQARTRSVHVRMGAKFMIPVAANEVVDDRNLVPSVRQVQGCGPSAVAVSPKHSNFHQLLLFNSALLVSRESGFPSQFWFSA